MLPIAFVQWITKFCLLTNLLIFVHPQTINYNFFIKTTTSRQDGLRFADYRLPRQRNRFFDDRSWVIAIIIITITMSTSITCAVVSLSVIALQYILTEIFMKVEQEYTRFNITAKYNEEYDARRHNISICLQLHHHSAGIMDKGLGRYAKHKRKSRQLRGRVYKCTYCTPV